MSTRFDAVAHEEWVALLPELHGLALELAPPVPPSDDELMVGIVEHLRAWGGWRAASSIVGCRLRDRAGLVICEVPFGNEGYALLHALLRDGRVERQRRTTTRITATGAVLKGKTRTEYRVPLGT